MRTQAISLVLVYRFWSLFKTIAHIESNNVFRLNPRSCDNLHKLWVMGQLAMFYGNSGNGWSSIFQRLVQHNIVLWRFRLVTLVTLLSSLRYPTISVSVIMLLMRALLPNRNVTHNYFPCELPRKLVDRSVMLDQWTFSQNTMPTLPKMQLSDITGGSSSDYVQLPLEPQKALYFFSTYALELPQDM